jgi:hypothetical protein
MKIHSCLIILLFIITLYGKTAPAPIPVPDLKPFIIPFTLPVHNAFTLPMPNSVGIEILISGFEYQFATLSFVDQNYIGVDSVPLDELKGATKAVLGSQDGTDLVLLQTGQIAVLDRTKNRVSVEYTTSLPRSDLQTEYFQGKITSAERLLVIAEMQPSVGEEGIVDATLHSLVYDDVRVRKTLSKIVLEHPLNEQPPVFFSNNVIIYRNKRKDISEPWKALDNTLSPVSHPLCALLDREFKQFFILGLLMSDRYKHAVVYTIDINTRMPAIMYVSWQTGKVSTVNVPAGMFLGQKNLMMSPSGKWAFYTATIDNEGKRTLNHTLLYLDPVLADGFLPPRIIAAGKNEDRVAWMSEPEGLVIFSQGQASLWDLSKFEIKTPKPKSKPKPKHKKR